MKSVSLAYFWHARARLLCAALALAAYPACQGPSAGPADAQGGFATRMAPQTRDVASPPPLTATDDHEPNDTRALASPLSWPPGAPAHFAQGVLDTAQDTDLFLLDPSPEAVRVTLTPLTPHHDLRLTLLPSDDHSGSARAPIDLGGAGAPEVIPAADARGGLLLQVNAGAASSQRADQLAYQLQLQRLPPGPAPDAWTTEREPNDAPASASTLSPGHDLQAWLNHPADTDTFQLAPTTPADLTISAPAACPLSIQLLEPPFAERSLLWQATATPEQPARYLSLRPGPYALVVRPASGKACAFPGGQPLPYKLTLTLPKLADPDLPELEPNDEPDTPHLLTLSPPAAPTSAAATTLRVRAALLSPDDIDRFRVTLPAPPATLTAPLRVRAVATPTDPTLDLALQAHLVEALLEQSFDAARAGQPEPLCDTLTHPAGAAAAPVTLDLRVQASPQGAPFTSPRAYTLDLTLHADAASEREPNDLPAIADPSLAPSTPLSGYIYPDGDADTFSFSLPTPTSITLSVAAPPTLDLTLALRDDAGADIARANKARAGQPERLTADLPAGDYHVTLTAQQGSSCAAPYTLTLSGPATAPSPTPAPTPSPAPSPAPNAPPSPDTPPHPNPPPLPGLDLEF